MVLHQRPSNTQLPYGTESLPIHGNPYVPSSSNGALRRSGSYSFSDLNRKISKKGKRSAVTIIFGVTILSIMIAWYGVSVIKEKNLELQGMARRLDNTHDLYKASAEEIKIARKALESMSKVSAEETKRAREALESMSLELEGHQVTNLKLQMAVHRKGEELTVKDDEIISILKRKDGQSEATRVRIRRLQKQVQRISKLEVLEKFGKGPYLVEFMVAFGGYRKGDIHDSKADIGRFVVELAPLEQMPHTINHFLHQVLAGLWSDSLVHHTQKHVLHVSTERASDKKNKKSEFEERGISDLTFQEYSPLFPHLKYTLGYAGRPGGPDFYISADDNRDLHGPGGQIHHDLSEEADPCFAKVVSGFETVDRMINISLGVDKDVQTALAKVRILNN